MKKIRGIYAAGMSIFNDDLSLNAFNAKLIATQLFKVV